MTCPICFDDMDMQEFQDELQSTETCFKLECGHAYHTKCIIESISKSNHKCPACNEYKSPEQKLEHEGRVINLLTEIRKDRRLRNAKHEFIESTAEYKKLLRSLNHEAKEWIQQRAIELKIPEHKSYFVKSMRQVEHVAKEVAKDMGPKYVAVLAERTTVNRYYRTARDIALYGKNYDIYNWRLRHPRIYACL